MSDLLNGVFAAVLTPLDADKAPDHAAMAAHCRWLLDHGCNGLGVLGTTGEANSFTVAERIAILEALARLGIPPHVLMPGTGCCALADTVALCRAAMDLGAPGVLVLPPFYYKNVSDDGLFAAFADIVEQVGDDRLRIYLYHFPQMSGVAIGPPLIERLLKAYPGAFAGMKDSSGDLSNMIQNARAFPGFAVFSGSDEFLLPVLRAGGAGCITAVGNIAAFLAAEVLAAFQRGDEKAAEAAQERLSRVRRIVAAYPLTAALKEIIARHTGNDGWRRIRPPLSLLSPADAAALLSALERERFYPPASG
jgi:4-hydroxy-tetrahydrodipicolinate synthase